MHALARARKAHKSVGKDGVDVNAELAQTFLNELVGTAVTPTDGFTSP
ncbi:MAG: hypothetical protein ACR2HA_13910 [Nocardioides sp.]